MKRLYTAVLYLLTPWLLLRLALRGVRNHAYWRRWPERFGFVDTLESGCDFWIHAVSVGEVGAAQPLISALQKRDQSVLVTTMTPTGSEQVRQSFSDSVGHCYAPYDFPGAVARFLHRKRPRYTIIMETEIWPNLIHACWQSSIPVVLANVRLSARSYRGYKRIKRLIAPALKQVSGFAVQTRADADRIADLGAARHAITITGSIKFEVKLPASIRELGEVVRRNWGHDRPVWIAGSTREGEEDLLLEAHQRLQRSHPQLLLVLVPRHPERFAGVTRLCRRAGFCVTRRSETVGAVDHQVEVHVGDTMGELTTLYAASDIAFVGGSLVPTGGHNMLEPCALGVPVLFGPHTFNFEEISTLTVERGAGVRVHDVDDLAAAVGKFLHDPDLRFRTGEAGKQLVAENHGALTAILTVLEQSSGSDRAGSNGIVAAT